MEKDIEILERYLKGDILYDTELDKAIENLLNRVKDLEEDLTSVYINGVYDGEKKYKSKIKEKIELIKNLNEKIYYEENVISILQELLEEEK